MILRLKAQFKKSLRACTLGSSNCCICNEWKDIRIPMTKPVSRIEKTSISRYRAIRSRIHEGPLYTILPSSKEWKATSRGHYGVMDPFEGMRTYSQQFQRQKNHIPKLDTRPYVMQFFPEELRKTLDPTYTTEALDPSAPPAKKKRKKLDIYRVGGTSRLEELDTLNDGELARRGDDDGSDDGREKGSDDEQASVNMDESFDEESGDDYDAENYFDGGDDDYGEEDNDMGGGEDTYE
ncbi:hypothetical protein EJ05DRAFT_265145 [Pseudovirgaria hyperparasitica]|uniref:DNA-directed RNA polymerase III subunit n=1 Tax=Pseudovirgaria hyperparasitica TaxID=470096 RepID=A0A6A6WFG5_9PEZI|nr:uncharacterized protein EJ05DRAFT_265145 [Pseudovirgaria hyperparasitica]KAF2761473.1 hypothetical protein EJ05DRAFT_265145 [Pseudovirgaria hyperparasitica]